ncbi:filamentous hemagglutinin N-terminal domain-containing protein [Sporomusa malonica]|uniref:Filamentous hemagglutinin family N-terminal domain-containing protein n=1 Tax=Sporomusa malonica TaxID=112901 RepID=A0A1W2EZD5_9FIRM|nr:filamentous hemagglutinin N-terminal domain-containing protein [Sporomusa malonica]SMD15031.1 filamentous hemagglutinin family N-terminal domain-containing protein [Sporomusa malonica]
MQRKWKRHWRRALSRVVVPAVAAATIFFSVYATGLANPSGGTVTSGSGSITNSGTTTTITQATDKLAINWQSFNIAKGETVSFLQPGAGSVALNRVVGNSGSAIYGALNANGKVFLINPNGILFAPGSQVNVGSLVASTQNLSDSDFLKGNYTFTGTDGSGTVLNQGTIQAADGGYVALLGNQVTNEGVILANQGSVALAAGNATTLDFTGDGLINLNVSQAALDAQVTNSNLIQANGGLVVMTAKAAGDLTGTVVNNTGIIRAQGLAAKNGKIVLDGGTSGAVQTSGTLDASSTTGMGGVIEVTGENIVLGDNARLLAGGATGGGQINIGGGWQGSGDISHAKTTTVNASAVLDASATNTGNGGTVVVWSDDKTTFAGTITAKGGQNGGDGGQVETSGKQTLKVADTARVNTLSVNGKSGNWLLDPQNYTIAASGGDITGATLSTNLSGGNITIHSSDGSASGSGDINVNDTVTWSSDNTLTLQADRNININSAITAGGGLMLVASNDINMTSASMTYTGSNSSFITMQAGQNITLTDAIIQSTDGALDVTLSAGLEATSAGSIKMLMNTSGSKILSSGGDILLGGAVTGGVLGALNGNPNDNAIQLNNAELISGSGKIVMKSDGGHTAVVLTDSKLTTTTGDIWIEGTSSLGVPANGVNMQGTASRANMAISSQDGNITIKGTSLGGTDWHNTGIWLTKVLIETTGTGNITVEGTAGAGTHASRGQNQGIRMLTDSLIQTVNGDISLVGIGASSAGTEGFNYGIWLYDSSLQSTGSGDISLQGVGGAGGDYNFGVAIDKSGAGSFVTTNTGTIDITGTGGTVGTDLRGIYSVAGTAISSTSGDISLTATGTNSQGYALTNRSTISTGGTGTISLTGVAVNGVGGSVSSSGTLTTDKQAITIAADGNIALNSNINAGTTLNNTGGVITLQSNGGTVTDVSGITIAADGLVLKGSGASYVLDDANYIIGRLAADTGSITFVQTGGVSIDTVGSVSGITATGPVSITTPSPVSGSATLYINAPITITSNMPTTLTLRSGNDLILNQGSAITAGNAAVNVLMASNLSGNGGYVRLLQNSAVTTNGGSLIIGGGNNGTDYAVAADPYEYEGVWIATSTINTGAGDITVRGKGYSGVRINGGSLTTTSGSIILDGIGDATGGSDASQTGGTGVFIKSYTGLDGTLQPTVPAVIQTDTGNITITGTSNNSGTDSFGSQNYFTGVNIFSDSRDISESTTYKGVYIGSRNGDITITGHRSAGDASANGNAGINTSSLTRIETTGSGNISLSNDNGGTAPANETGIILAGDVLSAGSGNVTVRGIEGLNLAGGNITAANGYISMYATENATQVNAATNLSSGTINGNLLLDGSAVYTLTSSQNGIRTLAGSARGLKLTTGTPLTVGTVNSVSGLDVLEDLFLTVASEGGLLTIDAPVARHYSTHTFGLTADRMAINAQVDQGQTNATWAKIAPYTAGWGIAFGSTTDTASNALEISAAEYAKLGIVTGSGGATSRNIQYGDTSTGAIQITDYMVNNSADNQYRTSVRLVNSSAITESGAGALEADSLVVLSDGDITLNGLNKANYFAAVSNNHDIKFHDALSDGGGLAIYPIGSYGGINAGTGNITLTIDGIASVVNMGSSITANGLELIGPSARFWLYGSPGVDLTINTLAGNVGTAAIGTTSSFSIGTVGSTVGLTSNGVMTAGGFKRALGLESGGTITQTAAISALDLYLGEGNFDLTNANNHAEKITTYSYTNDNNTSTVNVNYYDKGDILVNTAYENLYASGTVKLQGKSISVPDGDAGNNGMGIVSGGDITLIADQDITIGSSISSSGGDILLTAGEKFINNTASNTGLVANAGRYMVYSANPTDTIEGMTGYSKHYNQAYTAGTTPDYASSGNWFFYSIAPVISVTPGSQSATYGTSPGSFTPGYTGLIDGDTAATADISGTAAFSIGGSLSGSGNYTAGSHEVTYTGGLASSLGYTFMDNAISLNELTVTSKTLMVTAVGGSKVYDGTSTAPVTYEDNRVAGDSLTVSGSAVFMDTALGTGKPVSIGGLTLVGTDAANYTLLNQTAGVTADILPAAPNEQIETAVTRSGNQTTIQPASPVLPGNETGGNSVPVEIVQTGINQAGLTPFVPTVQTPDVAPPSPSQAPVQLTPLGGQTSGYNVAVSGQTLTVTPVNAIPATGSAAESSGNLAVLSVKPGEEAQPVGYYAATGGSDGLTLAPAAAGVQAVPTEPADTAAVTTYHLAAVAGAQAEFRIHYADGALSIHPVNEAAVALLQAGGDSSELVVATGILTALQNLGVTVQSIAAVYLH